MKEDTQQLIVQAKESIAKIVYDAMLWAAQHADHGQPTPPWQEGGNSFAQDEARNTAERILAITL